MVSTRLMSTSGGSIANGLSSSLEVGNYLRPSVVTRQSQLNPTSVFSGNMPSTAVSANAASAQDSCSTGNNAVAASSSSASSASSSSMPSVSCSGQAVATATITSKQTQAFKSSNTTIGSQMIMMSTVRGGQQQVGTINLLDLPEELLDNIFSYVGFKKIAQLRVVSQKMNDVCMHILNSTFSKLITKTYNRFQAIKANMPRRESARRNHPLACECDIIETCYMRLSLLQMTFGKHIERGHCCFFPGAILDEVYTILNYIRSTQCVEKPFRVTDELFDLSTMAMEYFRDRIEPTLPDIAYFNKDFFKLPTTTKRPLVIASDLSDSSSSMPSPPQSNMVLRKGIRKIKQGMKIYNNQLSVLRNELRTCKRKSAEQGKQIAEQQKLLAEQRKQTMEYANRLDENDKKNEEMSRKFSTVLQELNKCKTELQYWRSKSPAMPTCTSCGQKVVPILTAEDYQALINQGVKPEDIILNMDDEAEIEREVGAEEQSSEFAVPSEATTAKLLAAGTAFKGAKRQYHMVMCHGTNSTLATSINHNASQSASERGCNTISSEFAVPGEVVSAKLQAGNTNLRNLKRPYHMAVCNTPNNSSGPMTSSGANGSQATNNESELSEFRNFDEAVGGGPSAFAAAAGYSSRLFYGSSSSQGANESMASAAAAAAASISLPATDSGTPHKSVIVSPQSQRSAGEDAVKSDGNVVAGNVAMHPPAADIYQQNSLIGGTADGGESLMAINALETKKARRVQKNARCVTNSSGKRK